MFSGFHGTMKFLHENGYVSENMHPSMIIVLDEDAKHIRIVRIAKMPDDMDMAERKRLVQEDIKNAVIVQIGLFTGTLPYLRGNRDGILNFFKEHFDEIAQFFPEGDAPYYRGVLNGAVVYYCDFLKLSPLTKIRPFVKCTKLHTFTGKAFLSYIKFAT